MTETKREKFQRLAEARIERAVYHIALISNLGSKNYEYDTEDAEALIQQLNEAVDQVRNAFGVTVPKPKPEPKPEPVFEPKPEPVFEKEPDPVPVINNDKSVDRRDIRAALLRLTQDHGPHDIGVKALRKVVLGWA